MNEAVEKSKPHYAKRWLYRLFWTGTLVVLLVGFVIAVFLTFQSHATKKQLNELQSQSLELDRFSKLEEVYANRLFQTENRLANTLIDLHYPGRMHSERGETLNCFVAPDIDKFLIAYSGSDTCRVWVPDGKHTMIIKTSWDTSSRLDHLKEFPKTKELAEAFKNSPNNEHRIPLTPNYVYQFLVPEESKKKLEGDRRTLESQKQQLAKATSPEGKQKALASIDKIRRKLKWWYLKSNAPNFKNLDSSLPIERDGSNAHRHLRATGIHGYMRFPSEVDHGCNLLEPLPKTDHVVAYLKKREKGDETWWIYISVQIESEAPPCVDLLTGVAMAKLGWEKYLKPVDDSGRHELNLDAIEAAKESVEQLIVPDAHHRKLRIRELPLPN